jgi:hypothetical protein
MSCPGGNYVVPGADPCAGGGGGGGAIESINGLVGAITVDSSDSTLNVTATSATNISITNPNIISLNGVLGIGTLTSTDDSITVTNTGDNIDLAVKGGGALVLHFSGTTDAFGSYTNLLGDDEGYIMLDTTYAVTVTQTSAPSGNPIILYVSEKNTSSVSISSLQSASVAEPSVSFDAILVATNYRKANITPATITLPLVSPANYSSYGGGDPIDHGDLPTGPAFSTQGDPYYINASLNPTVSVALSMAGQMNAVTLTPANENTAGILVRGTNNLQLGFNSGLVVLNDIDWGVGIPSSTISPNFEITGTLPYATLTTPNALYYATFLHFPVNTGIMNYNQMQFSVTISFNKYT